MTSIFRTHYVYKAMWNIGFWHLLWICGFILINYFLTEKNFDFPSFDFSKHGWYLLSWYSNITTFRFRLSLLIPTYFVLHLLLLPLPFEFSRWPNQCYGIQDEQNIHLVVSMPIIWQQLEGPRKWEVISSE